MESTTKIQGLIKDKPKYYEYEKNDKTYFIRKIGKNKFVWRVKC